MELNVQQRRVVEADDGPLAVIAGPGTGKTKTLTARIAYLLKTGRATPDQILAVTFTTKAAEEMRQRTGRLLFGCTTPQITTFHGFCYNLLKQHGQQPQQFVTEVERTAIIREIAKPADLKQLSARELGLLISRYKNAADKTGFDTATSQVVARYDAMLQHYQLHDFDDLLLNADQLLNQTSYTPYHYLLIDEFQDTNDLQYNVARHIAGQNVLVIGDPLQSIYAFRGAGSAMFDRFATDFPQAQTISLTTNYRSKQLVVRLAGALFPQARQQPHANQPGQVRIIKTLNEYSEAALIVDAIQHHLGGTDMLGAHNNESHNVQHFRDFAVLYRSHHVARTIKQQLAQSGIPYQVVGEESPYAQPAVKALITLFVCIATGESPSERQLRTLSAIQKKTGEVSALLQHLRQRSFATSSQYVDAIVDAFNLQPKTNAQKTALRQCMNAVVQFDALPLKSCATYLQQLLERDCYDPVADAVTLLTIHAAKGLEFAQVFVCAVEEDILPHSRKNSDVEEEKRLLYVACTRAKDSLNIIYSTQHGGKTVQPSRFIAALPGFAHQDDPALPALQKRQKRRQQKRSQTTLFDM